MIFVELLVNDLAETRVASYAFVVDSASVECTSLCQFLRNQTELTLQILPIRELDDSGRLSRRLCSDHMTRVSGAHLV